MWEQCAFEYLLLSQEAFAVIFWDFESEDSFFKKKNILRIGVVHKCHLFLGEGGGGVGLKYYDTL